MINVSTNSADFINWNAIEKEKGRSIPQWRRDIEEDVLCIASGDYSMGIFWYVPSLGNISGDPDDDARTQRFLTQGLLKSLDTEMDEEDAQEYWGDPNN